MTAKSVPWDNVQYIKIAYITIYCLEQRITKQKNEKPIARLTVLRANDEVLKNSFTDEKKYKFTLKQLCKSHRPRAKGCCQVILVAYFVTLVVIPYVSTFQGSPLEALYVVALPCRLAN